jgi:hypothetical protein
MERSRIETRLANAWRPCPRAGVVPGLRARLRTVAVRTAWTLTLLAVAAAADPVREIRVDFRKESYDRWLFRAMALPSGLVRGHWNESASGLRGVLPKGPKNRRPAQFLSLFGLEGDFEIEAGFKAAKLPRPSQDAASNRVEVRVSGSDRSASVYRRANATADEFGYSVQNPFGGGDVEKNVPAKALSGRLKVRRVGSTLSFWRAEAEGPIVELGSVDFGSGPIVEVSLQVDAQGTTDGLDVTFEQVAIQADRIIRHEYPPASGLGEWVWACGLGFTAVVAAFFVRRRMSDR